MAFFWRKVTSQNLTNQKESLQITLDENTPFRNLCFFVLKQFLSEERTSSPVFSGRKGSLAVEASLILPLFLFFFLNLISILQLLSCYSRIEAALHQVARKWALYACAGEKEKGTGRLLSLALLPEELEKGIGKAYLDGSPVQNGKRGLQCYLSQVPDEEEVIDLVVCYRVTPVFALPGFGEFKMVNRCRIRAWTGYDTAGKENTETGTEELVYVTENGEVYHRDRQCTHLKLSISRAGEEELSGLRNQDGRRYIMCEKCGDDKKREFYYIADQGECYHTSLGCSGLKRRIMAVPISQVTGMGGCSRCCLR